MILNVLGSPSGTNNLIVYGLDMKIVSVIGAGDTASTMIFLVVLVLAPNRGRWTTPTLEHHTSWPVCWVNKIMIHDSTVEQQIGHGHRTMTAMNDPKEVKFLLKNFCVGSR